MKKADALLVHGGGIRPVGAGYELRPGSIARAETGVGMYFAGQAQSLVFSGGNAFGLEYDASEAGLMADIAVRAGVPAAHIEKEPSSTSTIGNWANSLPILEGLGAERVVGITGKVASHRAAYVGNWVIARGDSGIQLVGYEPSGENEGKRAYPREIGSSLLAAQCLHSAKKADVPLAELDTFYLDWKSRTGLGAAKKRFTRR